MVPVFHSTRHACSLCFVWFSPRRLQGWTEDSLIGDQYWHDMVKLHVSEEATWLHDLVDDSITRFTEKAKVAGGEILGQAEAEESEGEVTSDRRVSGSETQFMCAHVRRQDFQASCVRYEEEYRSARYSTSMMNDFKNGPFVQVL